MGASPNSGPEPLPCPCCGASGVDLYLGQLSTVVYGVKCKGCGLNLGRALPDRWPKETQNRTLEDAVAIASALTLVRAIRAWNVRKPLQ